VIYQAGNFVSINDRLIPAVNIQAEGVPGYLPVGEGKTSWFGVYFEVPFEDGSLWVVSQGTEEDYKDQFSMFVYDSWAFGQHLDDHYVIELSDWDHFLDLYDKNRRELQLWANLQIELAMLKV
jgi:hypothetical protein